MDHCLLELLDEQVHVNGFKLEVFEASYGILLLDEDDVELMDYEASIE